MDKQTIENHFTGHFQTFYDRYLPKLQKATGDELKSICPFHSDTNPSLFVNNQTGVFKCFGCDTAGGIFDFYAKLNSLDIRADFPKILNGIATTFGITNGSLQGQSTVVARYDYQNEAGKLLYQIERLEPKNFRLRRPDGAGWAYNAKGVKIIPYHLPEVLKADEVLISEGEKDVDNLGKIGFTATTNPFGAGKFPDHFGPYFTGKHVVLIPDNDDPGRSHMTHVAETLKDHTASIKWLDLPDLPEKGDVSDFIATFSSKEEAAERLAVIIEAAELYKSEETTTITELKIINAAESQKENGSPLTFPSHIMTGAAGYFSAVLADCMEPPQHFFFMAYLTCLGAVLANRITLKTELRPQTRLYLVILGESADDRKSTAVSKTVDFFQSALSEFHTCFGVGSAEGLQRRFLKDSNILLVYDELKAFVGKAKVDGSVLLPCVCTLFESSRYESHTRDREIVLTGACLSILAASTIETYERCWDAAFQDIGMTNRLFIVPGQGKRRFAIPGQVPSHERDVMKNDLGKILRIASMTPEIDITSGARTLYEAWYLGLEQSVHTKRLDTYALKFLILLAVNASKSEVDEAIVQDVIDLMNWQLQARRLHDPIDADSAVAKIEEKIRRILKTGRRSDTELKRAVHYSRIGTWAFTNAIRNLTRSEEIYFDKKEKVWRTK